MTRQHYSNDDLEHLKQWALGDQAALIDAMIDPTASKPNAVQCFLDPFEGAEFLAWKRRKSA